MLHIYFNEKSDTNNFIDLEINKLKVTAFCRLMDSDTSDTILSGKDIIEELLPYNSYILVDSNGKVKNYRKINKSEYKFMDMNRLGVSIKMDFFKMYSMFASHDILQIDTGMITKDAETRDIIIRIFEGNKNSFNITSDLEYDIGTFNSDDLVTATHPRHFLWDHYALKVSDSNNVYMSDDKGRIKDNYTRPISISATGDDISKYIEFEVIKYKGQFESELTRDIDNEDVFIESTIGVLNAKRVKLVNGKGKFRLYPFGYTGEFKIKLGRKWYEVWNEYSLKLGE